MRKSKVNAIEAWKPLRHKHATSIGHGTHSSPKNKHKRKSWKRYRGQGK